MAGSSVSAAKGDGDLVLVEAAATPTLNACLIRGAHVSEGLTLRQLGRLGKSPESD